MATKKVTMCDLCKTEITGRIIYFSAARYTPISSSEGMLMPLAEFKDGEFCSDSCVINAVRGLLNGG